MSKNSRKTVSINLSIITALMSLLLIGGSTTYAHSFGLGNRATNVSLNKLTTFTTQLNAEAGALNVIKIRKDGGDGPIMLDKAYVFVNEGLDAGHLHLHNLVVDGITLTHFGSSELNFVEAAESEDAAKIRGGEVTHMIHEFVHSDDLVIAANETIEFDFMAASSNNPSPTPISVMVHVKSSSNANVSVELVE